jgi:nitrite reductase/ring-hydroxylating ferredoxin subunit
VAHGSDTTQVTAVADSPRRGFLSRCVGIAMTVSLLLSYGTFAAMAGRFLVPTRPRPRRWLLVSDLASFRAGATRTFVAPGGERIVVARRAAGDAADDAIAPPRAVDEFVALSSTGPHLGCQVSWQTQDARFFCPCHNGTFAPDGRPTGGPPLEAGQWLPRYPLRIDAGLLYIEVPLADGAVA